MKAKTRTPRKHSGDHNSILGFLLHCINLGDREPKSAAWRIWENEWMSPDSKTGSDYKTLERDCERTWSKALRETEAGVSQQKRLKEFEKLIIAKDFVNYRVVYDSFTNKHLTEGKPTSPAAEYDRYNQQADDKTFIEKHFFQNAFEVHEMPQVNTIKEWAASLPKWDKKDWVKQLASYIPAKDPRQAYLFLTGWLIRAYRQAVNPNDEEITAIVNRWFIILHQHRQDSGKSLFFQWIAPNIEWVKLSGLDEGKDGYTALSKYLFVLDDELGGLSQAKQNERIKAMISVTKVDVRPPYAAADINAPRVASFCGSTNNDGIFPVGEGTSRFLTLPLLDEPFNWKEYTKKIDRVKLWAQIKHLVNTDWLDKHNDEIVKLRTVTNVDMVKEVIEHHVVDTYVIESSGEHVMRTGDVMRILSERWGYDRLNMVMLGQALKSRFGERFTGKTVDGIKCKGYKVEVKQGLFGVRGVRENTKSELFDRPAMTAKATKRGIGKPSKPAT